MSRAIAMVRAAAKIRRSDRRDGGASIDVVEAAMGAGATGVVAAESAG